jgi:hypothetical protein
MRLLTFGLSSTPVFESRFSEQGEMASNYLSDRPNCGAVNYFVMFGNNFVSQCIAYMGSNTNPPTMFHGGMGRCLVSVL